MCGALNHLQRCESPAQDGLAPGLKPISQNMVHPPAGPKRHLVYSCRAARYRSVSMAAAQPRPAAVTA